jgi:hypothetical protein
MAGVAVVLAYAGWLAIRGERPAAGPAPATAAVGAADPPAS